jgi:predicted nuclease of predicted toxin-antitoxin system
MKLLLDENLSKNLKQILPDHDVSHVEDEGWRSKANGELLRLMIASGYEVLITQDRKLPYQQNFNKYPIPVIVLQTNSSNQDVLAKIATALNRLLKGRLKPGPHELTLN